MGKGDKKTKRGKINIGSAGVRRARKKKVNRKPVVSTPEVKAVKPKAHPVKVKEQVDLEEAPVVQSIAPPDNVEVTEQKEKKKTAAKPKAPRVKKTENPDESQQQLL